MMMKINISVHFIANVYEGQLTIVSEDCMENTAV